MCLCLRMSVAVCLCLSLCPASLSLSLLSSLAVCGKRIGVQEQKQTNKEGRLNGGLCSPSSSPTFSQRPPFFWGFFFFLSRSQEPTYSKKGLRRGLHSQISTRVRVHRGPWVHNALTCVTVSRRTALECRQRDGCGWGQRLDARPSSMLSHLWG